MSTPPPLTTRALLLSVGCLLFAGCGGGEEEAAPTSSIKPRKTESSPVAPVVVQASNKPKTGVARPTQTSPGAAKPASTQPDVDPNKLFALNDADNTWEIAQTPVERNTFTVTARPPAGVNQPVYLKRDMSGIDPLTGRRIVNSSILPRTGRNPAGIPEGFHPVPGTELSEEGLPLRIICEADGSEMALIPAGAFARGTMHGPENTRPEHSVYLDSYYMAIHEVTLAQYEKFLNAFEEKYKRRPDNPVNSSSGAKYPALGMIHRDITNYAEWAKCQLPTEAQWEKAARGTRGYQFPWGNERPLWPTARSVQDIAAVMSYRTDVSPYGIYDLAGNAREWCVDAYSDKSYQEAGVNGEKLLRNPTGPRRLTGSLGVIRGNGPDWKVWHRVSSPFAKVHPDVGFRCVLTLKAASAETEGTPARDSRQPAATGF